MLFDVSEHVAVITLNRPAKRNAMSGAMFRAFMDCLNSVRRDSDIRAAVINGAGGAFCAGVDLKERAAGDDGRNFDRTPAALINANPSDRWSTMTVEKPLIAAVDGYALGGGFEISLMCDIRICSPEAQFGLPEIARGFFPGGAGPQRLARAIPQSMAMELLLTGDRIDAHTALRCGLVSRVVPGEQLRNAALKIARRIAGHAPLAVRAAKQVTLAFPDQTLDQAMRLGGALRWPSC